VQHLEAAEFVDGGADRRLQAVGVGHVGADRDRFVAGEMGGFIAGLGIDLSDSYFGTFAREQDGSGATDPGTGAGGEGYLACEPCDLAAFFDCLFTTWATWATGGAWMVVEPMAGDRLEDNLNPGGRL
jgi:hypothetical protein